MSVKHRIARDSTLRNALLEEGVECLLAGEADVGKSLLRDYVNDTIGIEEIGGLIHKSPKSVLRTLGRRSNPQARNLFEIIGCLQEHVGLHLKVKAVR